MMRVLMTLALVFVQNTLQQQEEGCVLLQLDPLEDPNQPLFLNNTTEEFLYPPIHSSHSWIDVAFGDTVIFSCIGGQLMILGAAYLNSTEHAICGVDSYFHVGDVAFKHTEIICERTINTYASVREHSEPCGMNGTLIEIGFDIPIINKFLTQSTICFNQQEYLAEYVHYNVTSNARFAMTLLTTASMDTDGYYPANPDIADLYQTENLQKNINPKLGLPENSMKYFNNNATLSPVILSDVAAFMYGAEQFATFRFANAAPMWVVLFNWLEVNEDIRYFAIHYSLNLELYTGTHGVLTFPHEETGEPVEIYLYESEETGKVIKVPEILWSVVYEPISKKALVVVMHNNVYLDADSNEDYCTNIYGDISWINWGYPDESQFGHGYICSYDDFKSSVSEVPVLEVTGILY